MCVQGTVDVIHCNDLIIAETENNRCNLGPYKAVPTLTLQFCSDHIEKLRKQMGARVVQWLEAQTGNHEIESSNPLAALKMCCALE